MGKPSYRITPANYRGKKGFSLTGPNTRIFDTDRRVLELIRDVYRRPEAEVRTSDGRCIRCLSPYSCSCTFDEVGRILMRKPTDPREPLYRVLESALYAIDLLVDKCKPAENARGWEPTHGLEIMLVKKMLRDHIDAPAA